MATYAELQQQITQLQKQAEQVRKEELAAIIADIRAKMAEYGITVADLSEGTRRSALKGRAVEPKYRDPASGNTWTGRGVEPAWLKGKNRQDFLIGK